MYTNENALLKYHKYYLWKMQDGEQYVYVVNEKVVEWWGIAKKVKLLKTGRTQGDIMKY